MADSEVRGEKFSMPCVVLDHIALKADMYTSQAAGFLFLHDVWKEYVDEGKSPIDRVHVDLAVKEMM
eukprot:749768-Hanusia_phi.AAC.6